MFEDDDKIRNEFNSQTHFIYKVDCHIPLPTLVSQSCTKRRFNITHTHTQRHIYIYPKRILLTLPT